MLGTLMKLERRGIWTEPARGRPADPSILAVSGLERMLRQIRGEITAPPIHRLTGLKPVEAGPGTGTFTMPASPWWQSPAGVFNAGVMAFLADAPLGSALVTALPPGKAITTSDLTLNYLRPATVASGTLIGRARLIHAGRRLGLAEATIEDSQGRLLGHGTTRCFVIDIPISEQPDTPPSWEPLIYETPDPYLRPVEGEPLPQSVWDRLTGLEVQLGLIADELPWPPVSNLTGLRCVSAEEGDITFSMPASPWMMSPAGRMYGGAIAFLADVALSVAVGTTVPAATAYAPMDLKVHFVRPVFTDGSDLVARATVTHRGRSLAASTAEVLNGSGKTVAFGVGSSIILPGRPWMADQPVVPEDEGAVE